MDDRLLGLMFALGLCALALAGWWAHRRWTEPQRRLREAQAVSELDRLIEAGLRTPDGEPACVVCRMTASEFFPISGVSWMDRLPLLNRLFSLPPRYVIVDNVGGEACLCKIHKAVAVRRLEEFHAELRAERAKFNAMHEQRVAAMDGGELLRAVLEQHAVQLQILRRDRPPKQLRGSGPPELEADIAVVSAGQSIPPEEDR